LLYFRFHIIL